MSEYPKYPDPQRVETELGSVDIHPMDPDKVRLEAGIPLNVEGVETGLVIRGVPLSVQAWAYRNEDGSWRVPGQHDRETWPLNMTNRETWKDATEAAHRKAAEVLAEAVEAWAEKNGGALLEAGRVRRAQDALTLSDQIAQARTDLETLERNLYSCENGAEYSAYPVER